MAEPNQDISRPEFQIIKSQKCYGDNKIYWALIINDETLSTMYEHKVFKHRENIEDGDKIQIPSPTFERNN